MSALLALLDNSLPVRVAAAGLLYVGLVGTVALVSVLAPTPERRRDARSTLSILIRWRRSK
ncbi:hypothetical protein ACGFRB_05295 [Streptomyces sp. NPDC048718]|uniref:hypothetical protein n=1 Tax=Streptomyces sp. NPDC048718 TaxID=3365587 RepID=UPI00371BC2B3